VKAAEVLDNRLGVAYLLLEWIDEVTLEDWSPHFPGEDRHVFLDGATDFLLRLWSFDTGRETFSSRASNFLLFGLI
jgi:hypothetical protein